MQRLIIRGLALLGLVCAASVVGAEDSAPQLMTASDGFPMLGLPLLMEHVVSPAAYGVWNASGYVIDYEGVHDLSPQSDEEWEEVVSASATLLETAHLMAMPERVLDDKWAGFVHMLNDAALEALTAAEAHDKAGISKVGDELDAICTACHKNYGYE